MQIKMLCKKEKNEKLMKDMVLGFGSAEEKGEEHENKHNIFLLRVVLNELFFQFWIIINSRPFFK